MSDLSDYKTHELYGATEIAPEAWNEMLRVAASEPLTVTEIETLAADVAYAMDWGADAESHQKILAKLALLHQAAQGG